MNADDAMLGASILGMLMCLLGGYWIGRRDGQDIERMNAQRLAPKRVPWRAPPPPEGWQGAPVIGKPNPPPRDP